ncbi:hypothetical protein V8G54_004590 [Vigna mungo]|uniref:Radical SAM core domain-containing protein n=1 Tax=Vigna mungo TaxID=3915 RepID=A0AAQ3PDQ4_VIGMU
MEWRSLSVRRVMAIGAVANSTLLLSSKPNHFSFSFSLTKTSPFLSLLTPRLRRFLSVSSLSADHHSLRDFGDGDGVRLSSQGSKMLLKGMTYPDLEKWVYSHGYRPGQAMMLWKRMYGNNIWAQHVDELEGLNKDFKKMLNENAEFKALALKEIRTASDGTRKILFTLDDGLVIETVVIPCDRGRTTVCVSSQVGCAMNCQFCYTGRMGLRRHLTAAEIAEQAVSARRLLTDEVGSITNVVFMVGVSDL